MIQIIKKIFVILITFFILLSCFSTLQGLNINIEHKKVEKNNNKFLYNITTEDGCSLDITRYKGVKNNSILMIHGYACSKKIFDWDKNHSLAKFLNEDGWDVWNLNLRTHDADGDFWFDKDSDRERFNRYWDFDRTYLKKDVAAAVNFIKNKTQEKQIYLLGHSMGGYLCYAYAELLNQSDLAGFITMGSSAVGYSYNLPYLSLLRYGFKLGKRAFVNPFGLSYKHFPKYNVKNFPTDSPYFFYKNTTTTSIQNDFLYGLDDEPAGVFVDIIFGKENRFNNGHWLDPQTLYDYTKNLEKIKVPCLLISGDEDIIDPVGDVFSTYVKIGSENKVFLHFEDYAHMDLVLGDNARDDIFSEITNWLNSNSSD